tara:strand:+ start:900 stop:1610 length:711 start_codon:yes stop_codon:yes gene_type:complete
MENTSQLKTENLFIDPKHIGIIIGKGGNTINQIRKDTGANIQLKKPTQENPDHYAIINGTDDQITDAIQYINKIINRVFKQDNTNQISNRWNEGRYNNELNGGHHLRMGEVRHGGAERDRAQGIGEGSQRGRGREQARGRGGSAARGAKRGAGRGGGGMGRPRDLKPNSIVEKAKPFSYQMLDFPYLPIKKIDNQTNTHTHTTIQTKSFADMVNYIEPEKEEEIVHEPKMIVLNTN